MTGLFDRVKGALGCDCPVCVRHGEAHAQVTRVAFGETVGIDEEMAPLVDALTARGVLTIGSCVDLADALARLWPEKLSELTRPDEPGVHYGRVVADRLAFVRVVDGHRGGPFLKVAQEAGAIVTRSRLVAQVAFPRDLLPALVAL